MENNDVNNPFAFANDDVDTGTDNQLNSKRSDINLPDFKEEEKVEEPKVAKSPKALKRMAEEEANKIASQEAHKTLSSKDNTPEDNVNAKREIDTQQKEFYDGTANVTSAAIAEMVRREEIEAELVRKEGRYIESVDNAKAGVTFRGGQANDATVGPMDFAEPSQIAYRADGVNIGDGVVLDTGSGAQEPPPVELDDEGEAYHIDDPRSTDFQVCVNGNCPYRESCLRYRMNDKRENKAIFFPDSCRIDGIYINVDDSNFTGYTPFENERLTTTPSM